MADQINATDWIVGTLFTEFQSYGNSEVYHIPVTDYPTAITMFSEIVTHRARILPLNASLTWARVSKRSILRDSISCLDAPLVGRLLDDEDEESGKEKCNNVESGLLFRFDDRNGAYVNKMVRCIRDTWVTDQWISGGAALATLPTPASTYTALPGMGNLTSAQALNNFLLSIIKNSSILRTHRPAGGPVTYDLLDIKKITFRDVRSRDTGLPFGRSRGRRPAMV